MIHLARVTMSFNSGLTLPTVKYTNSIAEEFPNGNRTYKVETGITGRYTRDYLPVNCSLTNGAVQDSYLEFSLNSNQLEFIDLNGFVLEMKIKLQQDGKDLTNTDNVTVIDGLGHRILSRCSVFLNGTPCESNAYYGLINSIDAYTSMRKGSLSSIGRNMLYNDLDAEIYDAVTVDTFTKLTKCQKQIKEECAGLLHTMTPLKLNISSADFYLVNGTDMRIRLDLSPAKLIFNAVDATKNYTYSIENVKLWTQKVTPDQAALISLNKSLVDNHPIEYIHERPVVKTFVFPTGHSSLSMDNIFTGVIPHRVYMFFMKQSAVNGVYNVNGAHLPHCSLSSLRMEINGNTHSAMVSNFPDNAANMFHHTICNLKDDNNLLTLQSFKNGRTIHSWDLRSSGCEDVLNVEKSGNLRISFLTDNPATENYTVFIVGITTGLIEIDGARRVKTHYLL